jgi:hypothetical protein
VRNRLDLLDAAHRQGGHLPGTILENHGVTTLIHLRFAIRGDDVIVRQSNVVMPGAPRQKQETGRRGNKVRFHALKGMNRMLFISPQLGAPALASQGVCAFGEVEQAFQPGGGGDFPVAAFDTGIPDQLSFKGGKHLLSSQTSCTYDLVTGHA